MPEPTTESYGRCAETFCGTGRCERRAGHEGDHTLTTDTNGAAVTVAWPDEKHRSVPDA